MKLLIDQGNSRAKVAELDSDGKLEVIHIGAVSDLNLDWARYTSIYCAQVGLNPDLDELLATASTVNLQIINLQSEAQAFGVRNAYAKPNSLGVDRWLTMVAAYQEQQKSTVIVDLGTASTVDWLSAEGRHLGGWIAPGYDLMSDSVLSRAKKVFTAADVVGRNLELGQDTPHALAHGCANAVIGFVKQALAVTETELDWLDYRLLFCGGAVTLIPQELRRRGEQRPDLVLQGLVCYATQENLF